MGYARAILYLLWELIFKQIIVWRFLLLVMALGGKYLIKPESHKWGELKNVTGTLL